MKSIKLIAWNTLRAFGAKKMYLLVIFLLAGMAIFQQREYYRIFKHITYKVDYLIHETYFSTHNLLHWFIATTVVAIIFASGLIPLENKHGTILSLMTKPVSRRELLLGKWWALQLFFCVMLLIGMLINIGFMVHWNIPMRIFFGFRCLMICC